MIELERQAIEPVYSIQDDGTVLLFAGDLQVEVDGNSYLLPGQVEMRLPPSGGLVAHFVGPLRRFDVASFFDADDSNHAVSVAEGATLRPPTSSALPTDKGTEDWADIPLRLAELSAGSLADAEHLIVHVAGSLEIHPTRARLNDGWQPQLDFDLPGWRLTLVPLEVAEHGTGFTAVIKAIPMSGTIRIKEVRRLYRQLFLGLGFVASREIGIGPVCGIGPSGDVVWAEWIDMRMRPGKSAARWCSRQVAAQALPAIANGIGRLGEDLAMEAVVDRGINHVFAANGDEVLDVRIPVACSGIELLAWAVLQRHRTVQQTRLEDMSAAEMTRELLTWANIPTALPSDFEALAARRRQRNPTWLAPDVLFNVRNKLVHPPPRLTDPEWPDAGDWSRPGGSPPGTSSWCFSACSTTKGNIGRGYGGVATPETSNPFPGYPGTAASPPRGQLQSWAWGKKWGKVPHRFQPISAEFDPRKIASNRSPRSPAALLDRPPKPAIPGSSPGCPVSDSAC